MSGLQHFHSDFGGDRIRLCALGRASGLVYCNIVQYAGVRLFLHFVDFSLAASVQCVRCVREFPMDFNRILLLGLSGHAVTVYIGVNYRTPSWTTYDSFGTCESVPDEK